MTSGREIDDGKASQAETDTVVYVRPGRVGTAVMHRIAHDLELMRVDATPVKADDTHDSAHA
jgi:hypothetical protein